jgi:hypothetical protein
MCPRNGAGLLHQSPWFSGLDHCPSICIVVT